ncbi:MAG: helix-turn-helix transcriptional regulator, partial [Casimicrobiaceae bacterium]
TVAVSDAGRRADPLMLASMFDLTPAETKVALAMMDGADVSEIAARNSVSVATIRSQLQSLFAKTGTRRQAKLVQLLLSAVAL